MPAIIKKVKPYIYPEKRRSHMRAKRVSRLRFGSNHQSPAQVHLDKKTARRRRLNQIANESRRRNRRT